MAEDRLARLRREWSEENRLIRLMFRTHMVETDRRFAEVGRDIAALGADFGRKLKSLADEIAGGLGGLSHQISVGFNDFGDRLALESANNEERYNQLFGRARLQDGRFDVFLGASQAQWNELEQRVSELERRLGPPPPAA